MEKIITPDSRLSAITSIARKVRKTIIVRCHMTGMIEASTGRGFTVLDHDCPYAVFNDETVEKMEDILKNLTDQERWYLLRQLQQSPSVPPLPGQFAYYREDGYLKGEYRSPDSLLEEEF